MKTRSLAKRSIWDRIGIGVSTVCLIHCLSIPVLVSILPLWPPIAGVNDWVHPVLILLIAPVIFFAIRRSHYDRKITSLLIFGFLLITAGWLLGHHLFGLITEIILTSTGSVALIYGHWKNYRHHQVCTNRSHNHHPIAEKLAGEDIPSD